MSSQALPAAPIYSAPVPFNLQSLASSRTFKPSRLAPPPLTATDQQLSSDTPSSPTTSSFYVSLAASSSSTRPRPSANRSHKSQSSARTSSSSPTSSCASSLRTVHQNSRLAKLSSRPARARDLSAGIPSHPLEPGDYTLGGVRNGEWEEWTEEEALGLELEGIKARREWAHRWRLAEEQHEDQFGMLGDLEEGVEEDGKSQMCGGVGLPERS
jgi:hypothetical protein